MSCRTERMQSYMAEFVRSKPCTPCFANSFLYSLSFMAFSRASTICDLVFAEMKYQTFITIRQKTPCVPLNIRCPYVFTALHGMQRGLTMRFMSVRLSVRLSVRPSVCLSNACIVIKRKKNQSRFVYHAKEHSL